VEVNEDFLKKRGFRHACFKVNYDISEGKNTIVSNSSTMSMFDIKGKEGSSSGPIYIRINNMEIVDDKSIFQDYTKEVFVGSSNMKLIYSEPKN
jgi:hypothetical protein